MLPDFFLNKPLLLRNVDRQYFIFDPVTKSMFDRIDTLKASEDDEKPAACVTLDCSRAAEGDVMKNLRILIADDHDLMRRGLKSLLESHPGWSVCAEAHTGREAIAKAEELKPDIVILDVTMPELNGVEAARRIQKVSPNTEILVLSVHYSDRLIRDILDAGVRGYILKSDADHDLVGAVEALANHKPFFTSRATELILSNFNSKGASPEVPDVIGEHLTS